MDSHSIAVMVDRMKSDEEYKREFFLEIIGRDKWEQIFSKLTPSALSVMSECALHQMSLDQLTWIIKRLPCPSFAVTTGVRAPRPTNPKIVHVWVIYWLFREGSPEVPLYVGMTRQLSERWTAHRNGSTETADISNLETVRIKVVETVCGGENEARAAEKQHISEALKINHALHNKTFARKA
jgi:predicted GIY-YIG superfamily endonuclease